MTLRDVITNYLLLILQSVVFSYTLHNLFTYGDAFDGYRLFTFICFGAGLGCLISSIIINCKMRS